jgi:hypothetical protein
MAWQALTQAGLPFDLIRSEEIRGGALSRYRMVFVPGGWASNKLAALGEMGREKIRRFVAGGGQYLGICGGGGMATRDGLGLLPVGRRPSSERVPSFSGPIRLSPTAHPLWQGIEEPVFCAWWPSQFRIEDHEAVRVLAAYETAQPGAFSSDIPVEEGENTGWPLLEERYGILLNPGRLAGEPAVVEGRFGEGRVILSLVHFDMPADPNGARALRNLWNVLGCGSRPCAPTGASGEPQAGQRRAGTMLTPAGLKILGEIRAATGELIDTGSREALWYWRNPLLLQWRRGVRGLEYGTLAVMIAEIVRRLDPSAASGPPSLVRRSPDPEELREKLDEIRGLLLPFCERAKTLLAGERTCLLTGTLSPLSGAAGEIGRLRQELFGSAMSHGGHFKRLAEKVDALLLSLIR